MRRLFGNLVQARLVVEIGVDIEGDRLSTEVSIEVVKPCFSSQRTFDRTFAGISSHCRKRNGNRNFTGRHFGFLAFFLSLLFHHRLGFGNRFLLFVAEGVGQCVPNFILQFLFRIVELHNLLLHSLVDPSLHHA